MIKPKVLFLCTANSCRTQMAEAMLRQIAGERFEITSAGADPTPLDPEAVDAMGEIGIDIGDQAPKDVAGSWDNGSPTSFRCATASKSEHAQSFRAQCGGKCGRWKTLPPLNPRMSAKRWCADYETRFSRKFSSSPINTDREEGKRTEWKTWKSRKSFERSTAKQRCESPAAEVPVAEHRRRSTVAAIRSPAIFTTPHKWVSFLRPLCSPPSVAATRPHWQN